MVFSIFAFGCSGTAKRPLNPNQSNNVAPNNMNTPNNNQTALTDSEARSLAKKLANEAQKVKGVRRASVVVSDNNLNNNLNNPNNGVGTVTPNGDTGSMDTSLRGNASTTNNGAVGPSNLGNSTNGGMGGPNNMGNNNNGIMGRSNNLNNNTTPNNGLNNFGNKSDPDNMSNNRNGLVVIVGLELDNMNNAGNMDNMHREVASRLKAADNRVSQVYVTTDASLLGRIDNVADNITNGRTMNALTNDIEDIFRSITAQGPAF